MERAEGPRFSVPVGFSRVSARWIKTVRIVRTASPSDTNTRALFSAPITCLMRVTRRSTAIPINHMKSASAAASKTGPVPIQWLGQPMTPTGTNVGKTHAFALAMEPRTRRVTAARMPVAQPSVLRRSSASTEDQSKGNANAEQADRRADPFTRMVAHVLFDRLAGSIPVRVTSNMDAPCGEMALRLTTLAPCDAVERGIHAISRVTRRHQTPKSGKLDPSQ